MWVVLGVLDVKEEWERDDNGEGWDFVWKSLEIYLKPVNKENKVISGVGAAGDYTPSLKSTT